MSRISPPNLELFSHKYPTWDKHGIAWIPETLGMIRFRRINCRERLQCIVDHTIQSVRKSWTGITSDCTKKWREIFFSRHNDGIKDYLNTGALYVFSLTRPTVHDIERTTSVVGSVGYTSISLLTANFTGVFITWTLTRLQTLRFAKRFAYATPAFSPWKKQNK